MSTNAYIGIEREDGLFDLAYIHSDGYFEDQGVGSMIESWLGHPVAIRAVIREGAMYTFAPFGSPSASDRILASRGCWKTADGEIIDIEIKAIRFFNDDDHIDPMSEDEAVGMRQYTYLFDRDARSVRLFNGGKMHAVIPAAPVKTIQIDLDKDRLAILITALWALERDKHSDPSTKAEAEKIAQEINDLYHRS